MEPFFVFLVRSSAAIALFYIVYWIFLRNETFHHANRWYFIGALSSSVLLPLFPLRYAVPLERVDNTIIFQALNENFRSIQPVFSPAPEVSGGISLINFLAAVYITGALLVLLRLFIQTGMLINLLAQSKVIIKEGIRIAENKRYNTAFTFFNILFINPEFFRVSDLPRIIAHEKVHIRECHWCDLVIIELLTVIFWFNPFIWFYEHSMRQNHEYLADKGVLSLGYPKDQYRALLLNQSLGIQVIGLTNCLNFSLNKNRFKMMTKEKTSRLRSLKFLLALPVFGAMLFACAEPWYQNQDTGENINDEQISESLEIFEITAEIVDEYGNPIPGVSVVIKGTTVGTITNSEGVFNLKLPLVNDLVLSYVGKETLVDDLSDIRSTGPVQEKYQRSYVMREGVFNIDREKHFSAPPSPPQRPSNELPDRVRETPVHGPPNSDGEVEIFFVVEEMPAYPGGLYALGQYVKGKEVKLSREQNLRGEALVGFTIDETGKVSNIRLVKSDNDVVARAAIDIVSGMDGWSPGKQRGKSVPVNFILPLEF
jgi:TonB family protein